MNEIGMRQWKATKLTTTIAVLLLCAAASAQSFSHILSFQGRLADTTGRPVPDGIYSVQLTIYDAETGGTALWTETQGVTQVGGVFTAFLGMATPFPSGLFSGGDRWLALRIVGDQEMAKRYRMAAAAFAIYSDNSDKVDGFHASATPTPSYILPLGTDGKFPLSAIPQGSGSTLDADLLDGLQAADFASLGHNHDAAYVNEGQMDSIDTVMLSQHTVTDVTQVACMSQPSKSTAAWEDIPDMVISKAFAGGAVIIDFYTVFDFYDSTLGYVRYRITVDGVERCKGVTGNHREGGWNQNPASLTWCETLTTGTHVIRAQWSIESIDGNGIGRVDGNATRYLRVLELKR